MHQQTPDSVYCRYIKNKPAIVFMGTYPPRECGIATFNQDLLNSSQLFFGNVIACKVAALNLSPLDTYVYPPEVAWQLSQNNQQAYRDLAVTFNTNEDITGIIIQHEYGIFGGQEGEYLLTFIDNCTKPIVTTLHTVLPNPTPKMKMVTERIIERSNIVVVLTESSKKILETLYPESINKVHVIPHGIHATQFATAEATKQRLKLQDKTVLTTFGLLSRGKGIEYVIRALPSVVKLHPSIIYFVLGKTHPVVRRKEGESYRQELAELVEKLELTDHVRFYDQYLSLNDLIEFLQATDIYISTSINPNQAVSGTLSYALGTGRAAISTEFAQAKEIITKETGRLVRIKDSGAYESALTDLLSNQAELEEMHRAAFEMTRPMLWSNVALTYSKLLAQHIFPPINLSHLKNMTDEFGLFQFAALDIPNKAFGYTLDDNARALVISSWLHTSAIKGDQTLIETYLHVIEKCQLPDGVFINYLNHEHKDATGQNNTEDLEDATARAMWALSEVMSNKKIRAPLRELAKKIFFKALPHTKKLRHIRSSAFMIKSFAIVLKIYPEHRQELGYRIKENADFLVSQFENNSVKDWQWFDSYLGYNNAVIPESLFIAGESTRTPIYIEKGKASLSFLIQKTFSSNRYMPIGHSHWYRNNERRSTYDQQPEDPASMILALSTAYDVTHDKEYRDLMLVCFSWFLGNNSLQESMYNSITGGCYDGLHPDRVNLNQGAESLVSYLLSRLTVEKNIS